MTVMSHPLPVLAQSQSRQSIRILRGDKLLSGLLKPKEGCSLSRSDVLGKPSRPHSPKHPFRDRRGLGNVPPGMQTPCSGPGVLNPRFRVPCTSLWSLTAASGQTKENAFAPDSLSQPCTERPAIEFLEFAASRNFTWENFPS